MPQKLTFSSTGDLPASKIYTCEIRYSVTAIMWKEGSEVVQTSREWIYIPVAGEISPPLRLTISQGSIRYIQHATP